VTCLLHPTFKGSLAQEMSFVNKRGKWVLFASGWWSDILAIREQTDSRISIMRNKLFRKIHNVFTPFAVAGFIFGVAMVLIGTFLPVTGWEWVTKSAQTLTIIGFILIPVSLVLFVVALIKTPSDKTYPSFRIIFGVKNNIWRLYKLEQQMVDEAGRKGLSQSKQKEVLKRVRHDLNISVITINRPLSEDETNQFVARINKKLGVKDGISKKALDRLFILGFALDECKVGVSTLLNGNSDYIEINNRLDRGRLSIRRSEEIKKLRERSYSLNSALLALLYLRPIGKKISPDFKIPLESFKEALDEEMHKGLDSL